ncbi:hypothetical protein FTO70_03985 [Methanosarcina sp. KYL-1]|uniref:DUF7502 family protein n=1 Tax=Methanosarcina sp. KYL-1 TaxID=2602068 RepID=UPI0021019C04|nr:hypothetical protein [Methanosarcina sp. KYL-1]MCQ1534861.1 hypothetical protein [Methanosarcina sp. KYL-1]
MLVISLLDKYKKYLRWAYRFLGFLQTAEKFALLLLLLILFNGYKLVRYFPELNMFVRTQAYTDPYLFNIFIMAAEAMVLTLIVTLIAGIIRRMFRDTITLDLVTRLERNFPELRTKLSTAYDNRQNFNIVTKKLLEDVHRQLAGISINKAAPRKQIFRSLLMLLLVSGAIIFCIHEGFSFDLSPGKLLDEMMENIPTLRSETTFDEEYEKESAPDMIYDLEALIIKNGEQVEMEINPSLGLGFTSKVDMDSENEFGGSSENSNDTFRYSQTYSENLPEEYEPMIKQYFEDLSS